LSRKCLAVASWRIASSVALVVVMPFHHIVSEVLGVGIRNVVALADVRRLNFFLLNSLVKDESAALQPDGTLWSRSVLCSSDSGATLST
jgi:hypothetical protein